MNAKQLQKLRKKTGLSQKEFAEKIDFSIRAVQSWEQGWRKMPAPADKLIRIVFKKYL